MEVVFPIIIWHLMEHVDKPLDLEITLQTKPYPQQNSGLGRFGISTSVHQW